VGLLEAHLAERPYLFGGRPAYGDFGLWGQLYNAWTDPTAGAIIEADAPNLKRWLERMLDPKAEGDFEGWSGLEATLLPFLASQVGGLFLPWSDANATALAAGEEEITLAVVERGEGLEIEVPPGTIIRAPRRGEVVYAGPLEGYGDVVIVDHRDGTVSISASVSGVRVQVGDAVDIGDPLAEAGRLRETGAPGFHFEVRREEETIDAISWLGSEDLRAALMGRDSEDR